MDISKFIKAGKDFELDILANPFGSPQNRDSDGEYFASDTNFYEEELPLPPVVYYHGGDEKGNLAEKPNFIGRTIKRWVDESGVWYRVKLNEDSELARKVWAAAQENKARVSSGAVLATVRIDANGKITDWMNGEVSIFDMDNGKRPANRYAIAVPAKAMKALYDEAGITLPDRILQADDSQAGEAKESSDEGQKGEYTNQPENDKENKIMEFTLEQLNAILDERDAQKAAKDASEKEREDAIKAAREEGKKEALEAMKAQNRPANFEGVNVIVKDRDLDKYDNMEIADQAMMIGLLKEKASPASMKSLARKLEGAEGKANRDAQKALGRVLSNAGAQKSDELNYSTQASYGDEWIGAAYSIPMWESIRQDTKVLAKIPQVEIPQGYESMKFLLESGDPTFYKVAQAEDNNSTTGVPDATITASKLGTADQDLTLAKLGARTIFSGEQQEDSLIPFMAQLRTQMAAKGSEELENIVINGDTETGATTNINDIGGTPAGTESFLLLNGLRKLPLITNTANSRSAGGSFASSDFLETVKLMGAAGINALDVNKVGFIVDAATNWAAMELDDVKTRDVFSRATIENGRLTGIFGYEVDVSPFMHAGSTARLANSAGKVDLDTTANNAYGAILSVRWDQWKFGWKRRMSLEMVRNPDSDTWRLIGMMRFGMIYRDTEASAISYYVGV